MCSLRQTQIQTLTSIRKMSQIPSCLRPEGQEQKEAIKRAPLWLIAVLTVAETYYNLKPPY